ncbi:hypothetical protein [Arenibacter aquaticus]|uniref:hypothetical protein n=1 Tax=Arenibacter aquaticus TaxID=2489054 RepID=UPI001EE4E12D|nr:hypothetical protein [Arenibacter aquaticus]
MNEVSDEAWQISVLAISLTLPTWRRGVKPVTFYHLICDEDVLKGGGYHFRAKAMLPNIFWANCFLQTACDGHDGSLWCCLGYGSNAPAIPAGLGAMFMTEGADFIGGNAACVKRKVELRFNYINLSKKASSILATVFLATKLPALFIRRFLVSP